MTILIHHYPQFFCDGMSLGQDARSCGFLHHPEGFPGLKKRAMYTLPTLFFMIRTTFFSIPWNACFSESSNLLLSSLTVKAGWAGVFVIDKHLALITRV
jgi:hypothetical protein